MKSTRPGGLAVFRKFLIPRRIRKVAYYYYEFNKGYIFAANTLINSGEYGVLYLHDLISIARYHNEISSFDKGIEKLLCETPIEWDPFFSQ